MDNLTHSLIGMTLGSCLLGKSRSPSAGFSRKAAILTSVLGSNIPDLDIIFRPFVSHLSFGYLLHHRGYTHTFLAAIPLGLLSAVLGAKLAGQKQRVSWSLWLLGIVSVLLHIGADFCNNYGVHPLTPFWNRWFYGDSIFIMEPLLLFVLLPFCYFFSEHKALRRLFLFVEVSLIGVVLSQAFWAGSHSSFFILCELVWAGGWFALNWKYRRTWPTLAGILFLLIVFGQGSLSLKQELQSSLEQENSQVKVQQIVTTPSPGNPFCWGVMILTIEGNQYVAKNGTVSLWPQLFDARTCYFERRTRSEGVSDPSPKLTWLTPQLGVVWVHEFRRPLEEFRQLREKNPIFQAFLKFARIPIWVFENNQIFAEDFRYVGGRGRGFSRVNITPSASGGDVLDRFRSLGPSWEPPTHRIP